MTRANVLRFPVREEPYLTYHRASAEGELVRSTPLCVGSPTYMHDFAITERYALFFDLPVIFNGWREPVPYHWSDDYGARIGVLPRNGRSEDVRWFAIAPCTIGHTANAYEDGGRVVIDVVRAPRLDAPMALHRYTLDLETGRVHEEPVDTRFLEFPRVDERRTGLRHRFVYGAEFGDFHNGTPTTSVPRKYDLETRASTTHDHGAGRVAGEGIVVPRAGSTGEDEGYIMTYVYDARRNRSDLVVHDAADFAAPALATIRLPVRVPYGIHASWLPDSSARILAALGAE